MRIARRAAAREHRGHWLLGEVRVRLSLYAAAAAAIVESGAAAAPAQAAAGESDAQLHRYVESVAAPAEDGRILRFETPVCPMAYGLPDSLNSKITSRMRAVASAAGAVVLPAGCRPNLLLFVPKDRQQLLSNLAKDRPEIFGRMTDLEIGALADSGGPAVAWHVLKQRGADGRELSGAWREGQPLIQESVTNSRLIPIAHFVLDTSAVVLDARSAVGMTPTEIADYAVMRGLAQTREAESGVPTILGIFRDKERGTPAPLSLTAMDLAYLRSLYRSASSAFESPRRGDVEAEMKRSLPNP
jgi:hypothetical protein